MIFLSHRKQILIFQGAKDSAKYFLFLGQLSYVANLHIALYSTSPATQLQKHRALLIIIIGAEACETLHYILQAFFAALLMRFAAERIFCVVNSM